MSTQTTQNIGKFVWHTLVTTDPRASRRFYTELFGWTATDTDMGPGGNKYTLFRSGETDVGGAMAVSPDAGTPSHWMGYATVDNVDAVADRAASLGGKVLIGPMDIPNVGRSAVVADPQGAVFAPFQGAPGAPQRKDGPPALGTFCWNELITTNPEAAKAFYTKLIGWKTLDHDMGGMGTYTMFRADDQDRGGLAKSQPNAPHPPMWLPYVLVTDVRATTARAVCLGARVVVEPKDVPGFGELAILLDPAGAAIALWTIKSN